MTEVVEEIAFLRMFMKGMKEVLLYRRYLDVGLIL